MKRRTLGVVLATACLSLSACAGQDTADAGSLTADGPGYDAASKTITVGALLPLSGPQASPDILKGLEVYVKALNERGGLDGGYKLKVDALDSRYDVPTALKQYAGAKDDVTMYSVVLGGPVVSGLTPQLAKDHMVAQPIAGDPALVHVPNIAPVQTPYVYGVVNGADYVYKHMNGENKKWCAANQDDITGQTYAAGAEYASRKLGFKISKVVDFTVGEADMTGQVQQLEQAGCQIVFYNGVAGASAAAATAADQIGYEPTWITQIPSWVTPYAKSPIVDYMAKNWLMVLVGNVPWDDKSAGQSRLRADMAKYLPDAPPTHHLQWGYSYGMATAQILDQAIADGDLSHAGIEKAITEIDKLTFDGVIPDYSYGAPKDRKPSSTVTVARVDVDAPGYFRTVEAGYDSEIARQYLR